MRLAFAIAFAGTLMAADSRAPAFFTTYCTSCHGAKVQLANRRFDQMRLPPADTLILLQDALDKRNVGAMPPREAKQPPPAEKQRFIDNLTRLVAGAHAARNSTGGQTVLRRLNRREYLNTIGDLLGINMLMFD